MQLVGGLYHIRKIREFETLNDFHAYHHQLLKEVDINPDWRSHFDLAAFYSGLSKYEEAFSSAQKASALAQNLDPVDRLMATFICFVLVGDTCMKLNQPQQAISFYQQALNLNIKSDELMLRMGVALAKIQDLWPALRCFNEALTINPDNIPAFVERYVLKREMCEWADYSVETDMLQKIAFQSPSNPFDPAFLMPHSYIMLYDDPAGNLALSRSIASYLNEEKRFFEHECYTSYRKADPHILRVGYISNDFNNHPKAHLISRMFGLHDRSRIKTYVYSYSPKDGTDYLGRIKEGCDEFVDVSGMDTAHVAARIYQDHIDILVDMKGYTEDAIVGTFMRRPAPIIANYLGWPSTTGSPFIDYLIADHEVIPEEVRVYYSESIAYLPHCYQMNDKQQTVASKPSTRLEAGLPEKGFVFCSFNRPMKLDPIIFGHWMDILHRVPESVLWLYVHPENIQINLLKEAEKHGINSDRIVFAKRLSKDQHLARLRFADLFLDIPTCNAHVTGTDVLLADVPILTCRGKQFAARVASSLLKAAELPELITDSIDAYKDLAVKLATDPAYHQSLRQRLIDNKDTCPLFDSKQKVKDLEDLYFKMWEAYQKGEKPKVLTLN